MPCWYDLRLDVKRYIPLALGIAGLAAYLFLTGMALWAPKLQQPWLKRASRVVGFLGLLLVVRASPLILLFWMLVSSGAPTKIRSVNSLTGDEASVRYNAGFFGRDFTDVVLKRAACCRHVEVMWHAGPSELQDMHIEWPDNRTLHLTYHARSGDAQHCEQQVSGIAITCTVLPLQ